MKVLHITNWYSNPQNPQEASWIQRHINALAHVFCENEIWHVQTMGNAPWSFSKGTRGNLLQWRVSLPTSRWIFIEVATFLQLLWLGIRYRRRIRAVDIINFHIAYPLLVFWKLLKPFYNKPVVITEHWSAYHFNFGVQRPLPRIQRIFKQGIPVISVSQALADDIRRFSQTDIQSFIVPNVVEDLVFYADNSIARENVFFMVSQWKEPKDPFTLMMSFLRFNAESDNIFVLRIGGYGQLWSRMEQWVREHDNNLTIQLSGMMDESQIGDNMRRCKAFLHPSNYETFSVVCAEAVSCGALVVAPKIGGIPEVVGDNGILLEKWDENGWYEALKMISSFAVAGSGKNKFSKNKVGRAYRDVLEEAILQADKQFGDP